MKLSVLLLSILLSAAAAAQQIRGRRSMLSEVLDPTENNNESRFYSERFEFEMEIGLLNGDIQCVETNLQDISDIIMNAIKETESAMNEIVYEDPTVLAIGGEVTTEFDQAEDDPDSDRRHLRFKWRGGAFGTARLSYADNSDGFIPGLGGSPPDATANVDDLSPPLNYNLQELADEQKQVMEKALAQEARLIEKLSERAAMFEERLDILQDKLKERIEFVTNEKNNKNAKWYARKMDQIMKLQSKIEDKAREFIQEQAAERLKMQEQIELLKSQHKNELSTVMVAREPAWKDFTIALNGLALKAEANVEDKLAEAFPDCFSDGSKPDVDLTMTPVLPKL